MKKIAIVPSRETKDSRIYNTLWDAGFAVTSVVGSESIFQAVKDTCEKEQLKPDDQVILCHDDLHFISGPNDIKEILDIVLKRSDVGFVGVAGASLLQQNAVWWDGIASNDRFAKLSGLVYHGKSNADMEVTFYGPHRQVVVMDGLFLATTGKVLNSIQLSKPKDWEGNWDFYDIFYTFQTHLKGLKNFTVPICLRHSSKGELVGRDSWHKNRESFIHTFINYLPQSV